MTSLIGIYNLYKEKQKLQGKKSRRIPKVVFISGKYARVTVLSDSSLKIELTADGLIKLNNIFSDEYMVPDKKIIALLLFDYIESNDLIIKSSKKIENPVGDVWTYPKKLNPIDSLVLKGMVVYKNA